MGDERTTSRRQGDRPATASQDPPVRWEAEQPDPFDPEPDDEIPPDEHLEPL